MKTFKADEGHVFVKNGNEIMGTILYTPDDFDESSLSQITSEQAHAMEEEQRKKAEEEREKEMKEREEEYLHRSEKG